MRTIRGLEYEAQLTNEDIGECYVEDKFFACLTGVKRNELLVLANVPDDDTAKTDVWILFDIDAEEIIKKSAKVYIFRDELFGNLYSLSYPIRLDDTEMIMLKQLHKEAI